MIETIIKPISQFKILDLKELYRYRELFYIFSWRDIKVRYKQTILGILWVILQPLLSMVIFTVFFGNFAKIPADGLPYPVFVLLGLVFWNYFSGSLARSSTAFIDNENLVKKVYFPREILPYSSVVTAFVDFIVSLGLFFIIILFYQVKVNLAFGLMVLIAVIITTACSAGLGLLLASINIKYRDVRYIIPYFLQLMIFVTPVIYPLSIVRPSFQLILSLNPMAGVINSLRSTLVTGTFANSTHLAISFIASIAIFIIGMIYYRRTERYFADIL